MDDAEFGREFVRRAVTTERVEAALQALASRKLRLGPYSAAGLASVAASGSLGAAQVQPHDAAASSFLVTVPAAVDLSVRLGAESRLRADVEVELTLTPRPADPLLLVIDIAPLEGKDVRTAVHGRGLGTGVSALLSALTAELRGQVARQVSGLLDGDGLRKGRTIDVAARIDGRRDAAPPEKWEWIDHAQFGHRFVRHAVTEARLSEGFAGFAGRPVGIGPLRAGPRGMARFRVDGAVGEPAVHGADGSFDVTLPLSLDLVVGLARDNEFHADVTVVLHATPRPAADLHLVVDFAPVQPDSISVRLTSADAMSAVVGRAGKLEEQIRRQVADVVNQQIGAATGRVVDIGARIDAAGRSKPRPRPS